MSRFLAMYLMEGHLLVRVLYRRDASRHTARAGALARPTTKNPAEALRLQ